MKKKITIIVNNFWGPAVYLTGIKSILDLVISLSLKNLNIEIEILTNIDIWDKSLSETKIRSKYDINQSIEWIKNFEKKNDIKVNFFYVPLILKSFSFIRFIYLRFYPIVYFLFSRTNNYEILHEFSSSPIMLLRTLFFKKVLKKNVLHTFLTLPPNIYKRNNFLILDKLVKDLTIITTNNLQMKKLRQLLPNNNIDYLSIGYTKNNDNDGEFSEIDKKNSKIISFLGPLRDIKGYKSFINLAKFFEIKNENNYKFIIACHPLGTDKEHNKNLKKIKNMKIKNLYIYEQMINKQKFFNFTDIILFPQTTYDGATGHPVTLLEAMGYNKFCIVNKIPGLIELINYSNGIVCDTTNEHKLYNHILEIFDKKTFKNIDNTEVLRSHRMSHVADMYIEKYF
jgi:glycosyltransferase involved in cell wall biosynthesis